MSTTYAGLYQWTVNLEVDEGGDGSSASHIQLKFGPTAWFANEEDQEWTTTVDPRVADCSCVFVTYPRVLEIRQSTVHLREVLDGLEPGDRRLHDAVVELLAGG